jgi:hypothetical protein
MLRLLGCAVLGLLLCAGTRLATAQDTKKSQKGEKPAKADTKTPTKADDKGGKGRVTKVDLDKHVLVVSMSATGKEKEFMLDDATKVIDSGGRVLKVGLKSKRLKPGASVTVKADEDGKAKEIVLGKQLPPPSAEK